MSTAEETNESLFSGYRGRVLLSITGGSFFISMVAMVVPPLLPRIRTEFGISAAEAGLLMTVWWLAVALLNAPGGRLADELTHKTGLVVGLGIALVGVVVLLNANLYVLLILGITIVGVGRGIYQPSAIGLHRRLRKPPRRVVRYDLDHALARDGREFGVAVDPDSIDYRPA